MATPIKIKSDLDSDDVVIVSKRLTNQNVVSGQTSAATLEDLRAWFDDSGWGYYVDDPSNAQVFPANTRMKFTVDKFFVDESEKPDSVDSFLDGSSNITGESGDDRVVRVQFNAAAQDQYATQVIIELDIGGSIGVIDTKPVPLFCGQDIAQFVSESFELFCRETFEANGCAVYLTFDAPVVVSGRTLLIKQSHKNRNTA